LLTLNKCNNDALTTVVAYYAFFVALNSPVKYLKVLLRFDCNIATDEGPFARRGGEDEAGSISALRGPATELGRD